MPGTPMIFTDGLLEASVQHGVVRMVLGQLQADGKPAPAGQVCIPLSQLPALAQALGAVVRQIEAKLRETGGQPGTATETAAMPGAFTFQGR